MNQKKVLFIVRSYLNPAPLPLRFQKIISKIKNDYSIHVLMMHNGKISEKENRDGITIHKLPYSFLSKVINNSTNSSYKELGLKKEKKRKISWRLRLSKLRIRKLMFPDPLIIEYFKLRKKLKQLNTEYEFDIIVGSSYPHTTLMLSNVIKNKKLLWIHDIGDPLFSPLNGYRIRAFFSYLYENYYSKYVNRLVVTNSATKEYYLIRYNRYNANNVKIIQQGGEIITNYQKNERKSDFLNLVYAGTFYDKKREPFQLYKALDNFKDVAYLNLYGNITEKHLPSNSITNIRHHGSKPYEVILKKYHEAEIVVYIDNSYGPQTPGKVFEIISTNKPILCIYENEESVSIELFKKVPFAFICKNDSAEIISTLNKIIQQIKMNEISFEFDVSAFSWEKRAQEFKEIIEELTR